MLDSFPGDLSSCEALFESKSLEEVRQKAAEGQWEKSRLTQGREVEEYLEDKYLKTLFGNKKGIKFEEIQKARVVVFKYICLGIVHSKKKPKNYTCAINFVSNYTAAFKEVVLQYPELLLKNTALIGICKEEMEGNTSIPSRDKEEVLTALNDIIRK
jgi:hypothetical protein